jgi:hypothetical protein
MVDGDVRVLSAGPGRGVARIPVDVVADLPKAAERLDIELDQMNNVFSKDS